VEPEAQVVPVVQVAAVQVQDSSVQLVVADSVKVLPVELQVVQEHQHVQVLVLTVHQLVAAVVVAVVPAVEPLVLSAVAAASPRHVSRRERKEQSLNSARHHRLVALAFLAVTAALLFVCAVVHLLLTLLTRSMQPQRTW
jgi:hypothetical protein